MQNKRIITIQEQKQLLLMLLKEFDSFCDNNNIKYFITGGTLIGAIRHKGFIPWDDDIDVCLLRDDYEKFIETYIPSKSNFKLLSLETDPKYNFPFAKLVDDNTILIENSPGSTKIGVYLDIFPVDNCPGETKDEGERFLDSFRWLRWKRNFKIIPFSRKRKWYKNVVLFVGKAINIFTSRRRISEKISQRAKKYEGIDSKYVCGIVNNTYGYGEVLEKKLYEKVISVQFEDLTVKASSDYDIILTSLYGNYMELPPEEKRKSTHDYVCWYKN